MPDPPLVAFVDDPTLSGDIRLLRRVKRTWLEASQSGDLRVTSFAFQLQAAETARHKGYPDRCMSVALESIVISERGDIRAMLDDYDGYGLAVVTAGLLRECRLGLQHVPELGEPWHVAAFSMGSNQDMKKAKTLLARNCGLLIAPS